MQESIKYISRVQRLQRYYEIQGGEYLLWAIPVIDGESREELKALVGVVDSAEDAVQWVAYSRVPLESLRMQAEARRRNHA